MRKAAKMLVSNPPNFLFHSVSHASLLLLNFFLSKLSQFPLCQFHVTSFHLSTLNTQLETLGSEALY